MPPRMPWINTLHQKIKTMNKEFTGIICPHCGYETGIEPSLVDPDSPMLYCPECDEALFGDYDQSLQPKTQDNGTV